MPRAKRARKSAVSKPLTVKKATAAAGAVSGLMGASRPSTRSTGTIDVQYASGLPEEPRRAAHDKGKRSGKKIVLGGSMKLVLRRVDIPVSPKKEVNKNESLKESKDKGSSIVSRPTPTNNNRKGQKRSQKKVPTSKPVRPGVEDGKTKKMKSTTMPAKRSGRLSIAGYNVGASKERIGRARD